MFKSSRNLFSRFRRYSVPGTVSVKEIPEFSWSRWHNSFSTWGLRGENDTSTPRTSAEFSIYKGKAALGVRPVPPKFSAKQTGTYFVSKRGSVLLTFLPAVGVRKYDHERKQLFALSPTEIGCLTSLGAGESCEFFHDPSMQSSNQGQVRKTLNVSPMSDDGGFIFSLRVVNGPMNTEERFTVPVSKAEFSVLRTSLGFILPHIIGWGRVAAETQLAAQHRTDEKSVLEWNR
ncbi:WHIRLY 2 [Wolffia australiana]